MTGANILILFVKYPEKGRVKTRLIPDIGAKNACCLYSAFVRDMLSEMQKGPFETVVFYTPAERKEEIRALLGARVAMIPQEGSDLGTRMRRAFERVFEKNSVHRAVIVGSDIPDLAYDTVAKGFDGLRTHDVVIGPASDGGYYAIGFSRSTVTPAVFQDMAWGTDGVFRETWRRFVSWGWSPFLIEEKRDVDTGEDMACLIDSLRRRPQSSPATRRCLKDMGYDLTG